MFGVLQGYQGLINNNINPMDARSVSNIIHLGGTILKTARCLEFKTEEGMQLAFENLKARDRVRMIMHLQLQCKLLLRRLFRKPD